MFVELHIEIVLKYCSYILKQAINIGLNTTVFCKLLIEKVIATNDGYICDDSEWNIVLKVLSRFAAIQIDSEEHKTNHNNPSIENIENKAYCDEIVLKLWMKTKEIVDTELFCNILRAEIKTLLNENTTNIRYRLQSEQHTEVKMDDNIDIVSDIDIVDKESSNCDATTNASEDDYLEPLNNDDTNIRYRQRPPSVRCNEIKLNDKWKISQFTDDTPNIYHNMMDNTQTTQKPQEILQIESNYADFVDVFFTKHNRIPLFEDLPYFVKQKLEYMVFGRDIIGINAQIMIT